MKNKKHVITRTNRAECGAVCQNDRLSAGHIWQTRSHVYGEVKCQAEVRSDVVIPNELDNDKTCFGLRHWRLLPNLKNNFSKPVRNDMVKENLKRVQDNNVTRHTEDDSPKYLQTLEYRFFAYAQNDVINKTLTNLFPYFPISFFPKKKVAFTLAEVLITLGIIGIVAAMTIPTLMQKYYERQTVVKLKETYSILSQALKSASQEEGLPEEWGLHTATPETAEKGGAILKKYLKLATDCGVNDERGTCFPQENYVSLDKKESYNLANTPYEYKMILLNGSAITFRFVNPEAEKALYDAGMIMSFKVDTNGPAKPNVIGRDLFMMRYYEGKGLLLEGAPNSGTPYKYSCKMSGNGTGCAYYVVTFGNMDYLRKK